MSVFELSSLRNSSVWGLYRIKDRIDMDPVYQREGDVWDLSKKQLLMDTIINQFDVPKIYLQKYPEVIVRSDGTTSEYAVIDGKQRLNAIWSFIDGQYPLTSDFEYIKVTSGTPAPELSNLFYNDIGKKYPNIKTDFDAYLLDVVCIETDDTEIIEDLFSRLNEAVPLSAPEKRNAMPGPLPKAIRSLVEHTFFTNRLPFTNKRYRHLDLAAKFMLVTSKADVVDTKKRYLDNFFDEHKKGDKDLEIQTCKNLVIETIEEMNNVFLQNDPLLRNIGMCMLYFYILKRAIEIGKLHICTRDNFENFEIIRKQNREQAELDNGASEYKLLEFDRFTQSPNDAYAMRFRLAIIDEFQFESQLGYVGSSL